jgi:hypothetical protein
MSRETEVAAYLRSDEDLALLAPGGIYADGMLATEGIGDVLTTPDVWAGGVFQTSVIVRQRQRVPTGLFTNFKSQIADSRQVIEVWAYALEADALEAVLDQIYALMQGHPFSAAWPSLWIGGGAPIMQCPELPPGIYQSSAWYELRSLRRAVAA